MAKILFTAFLADVRGKVAGTVFSKNRSGAYVRTKVTPSNPQTSAQSVARQRLSNLSQFFRTLTAAQVLAWNNAVDDFSSTNVFGNAVRKSGINLFVGLNSIRQLLGEAILNTPPSPGPVSEVSFSIATLSSSAVDLNLSAISTGEAYLIEATSNQSPGKSFLKNQFRLIGTVDGTGSDIVGQNLLAAYTAKFGAPISGQRIGFRIKVAVVATGQIGNAVTASQIVA
jgi:hypothetical protein